MFVETNKNNTTVEDKPTEDQKKFFLDLLPGKLIDIQFNNPIQVRFKLTLIGYDTGKYLILKYPAQAGKNDYSDILV